MNKKDCFIFMLIAGLSGMLGGGIVNYSLLPSPVIAESQSTPMSMEEVWEEYRKREEKRQEQKSSHLKSLNLLHTEGIVLTDKQGKTRAALLTEPNGDPYLEMFDENGYSVARWDHGNLRLQADKSMTQYVSLSPRMLLLKNGDVGLTLTAGPLPGEGASEASATLNLSDLKNNQWVSLSTKLSGANAELMKNLVGKKIVGPGIRIAGEKGKEIRLGLETRETQSYPLFEMQNDDTYKLGFMITHLPAKEGSKETMAMGILDKDSKTIWSAP